jgi:pyruvate formate lyase activating enzyme
MRTAIILNVQRCSLHDGPGLRTTVFLKGCPLRCLWCHNPESVDPRPQLAYTASRCVGCGECARVCPNGVHRFEEGKHAVDWERCRRCGACAEACYAEALETVGKEMTIEEVLAIVERDREFYDSSGGGVTISGGEPLAQAPFAAELLRESRGRGLHATLDTSGFAQTETLLRVASEADLVLFDLKHIDDARHRELTGVPNGIILENLVSLIRSGAAVRVRVPLVPGCNDDTANVEGMASFLSAFGGQAPPIDLLPYHQLGASKHARLGSRYELSETKPPTDESLDRLASVLRAAGLPVQVGG